MDTQTLVQWVGIWLALAMIIVYCIFRSKVPWWVAILWLVVIILYKLSALGLLGVPTQPPVVY